MRINPDTLIVWQWGVLKLNVTLLGTWLVMLLLVAGAWLLTRRLQTSPDIGRWQSALEILILGIRDQIREVSHGRAGRHLPFIGSLFLFIALSNLLAAVPGFTPPTASLSTAAALALCVFIAVPLYGIARLGVPAYLKQYLRPTALMLPFNLIGELSRTLALAVRLYGNIMSGSVIAAILLTVAPLFFPVLMQLLGLLTGLIQAYIFAVLALVYIASAENEQARRESRTGGAEHRQPDSNERR